MANAAIFIGWGNPVRGREQKALEVFSESMTYWGKLQEQGAIEGVQSFLMEPHGGELAGCAVLTGDPGKLADVHASEEFQRLVTRANLIVENLSVVRATTGEAMVAQMGVFAAQVAEIA